MSQVAARSPRGLDTSRTLRACTLASRPCGVPHPPSALPWRISTPPGSPGVRLRAVASAVNGDGRAARPRRCSLRRCTGWRPGRRRSSRVRTARRRVAARRARRFGPGPAGPGNAAPGGDRLPPAAPTASASQLPGSTSPPTSWIATAPPGLDRRCAHRPREAGTVPNSLHRTVAMPLSSIPTRTGAAGTRLGDGHRRSEHPAREAAARRGSPFPTATPPHTTPQGWPPPRRPGPRRCARAAAMRRTAARSPRSRPTARSAPSSCCDPSRRCRTPRHATTASPPQSTASTTSAGRAGWATASGRDHRPAAAAPAGHPHPGGEHDHDEAASHRQA